MKPTALLLTIIMLFTCCLSLSSCNLDSNQTNSNQTNEITLTKDNFKDYFTIEVDTDINTTKHGDIYQHGIFIPPFYSAVADVDVNVFASRPVDAYNVKVTLEVKTSSIYWNKQTITLYLSSNGSANKNLTITTSDSKTILFEYDCNKEFYASIVSVEGTIKSR